MIENIVLIIVSIIVLKIVLLLYFIVLTYVLFIVLVYVLCVVLTKAQKKAPSITAKNLQKIFGTILFFDFPKIGLDFLAAT